MRREEAANPEGRDALAARSPLNRLEHRIGSRAKQSGSCSSSTQRNMVQGSESYEVNRNSRQDEVMLTRIYRTLLPEEEAQPQPSSSSPLAAAEPPTPYVDCPLCRLTGTATLGLLSAGAFKEAYSLHNVPRPPSVSNPRGRVLFLASAGAAFAGGAVWRWYLYPTPQEQAKAASTLQDS